MLTLLTTLGSVSSHNHYNKGLKGYARENRNQSTKAEVRLWCEILRDRQLLGFPFLRQRPIANYIADFLSKDLKLLIEVDGSSHESEEAYMRDLRRDTDLHALGFTTLRFTNDAVMHDLDAVRRILEDWITSQGIAAPPERAKSREERRRGVVGREDIPLRPSPKGD